MLEFMKSPLNKVAKGPTNPFEKPSRKTSSEPVVITHSSKTNPFDSDSEDSAEKTSKHKPSRKTSSEPVVITPSSKTNPFDDDDEERGVSSSSSSLSNQYFVATSARNKYKNDFRDSGGLQNQKVEELENYALYKAEENTKTVNNCLKIAGDIREDATKTLVTLHQQGEQITRTHMNAADIEQDLSRGEKLLGSLGGIFSKTWKPKMTHKITGPVTARDHAFNFRPNHIEQRERLGLSAPTKQRQSIPQRPSSEPITTLQKVEVEKNKQDDALNEVSNILDELKDMALDMGSEIGRQNKALDPFHDDVDELSFRIKGASNRGRHLLGK